MMLSSTAAAAVGSGGWELPTLTSLALERRLTWFNNESVSLPMIRIDSSIPDEHLMGVVVEQTYSGHSKATKTMPTKFCLFKFQTRRGGGGGGVYQHLFNSSEHNY